MTASGYKEGVDSSLGVLTPEGIEFTLFPAGLPIRTCAYAIDKSIQWAFLLIIIIVASLSGNFGGRWMMLILLFLIDWFYHVIFELLFRGQSPGKRIMGIRVVRSDGSPVNPGSSLLRNLLRFADTFFFLCPIALITMSASGGFRRLGDWAGGTLVIYAAGATSAPPLRAPEDVPPSLRIDGIFKPDISRLSHAEKQAILMFARRYPLLGEARANEIAQVFVCCLRQDAPAEISDSAYLLAAARRLAGGERGAA
ncbi:MAG: RDD family protein [Treponema sp.]|jgi:uncharacterized RDD family membrane protein YckC|nr:RDD family protein [Treponema sp.]